MKKPTDGRNPRGHFEQGCAPGPGRPRGRSDVACLFDDLLADNADKLIRSLLRRALSGHSKALSLCIERIAPVPRGRPMRMRLPVLDGAAGVVAAHDAVLAHLADGEITIAEAESLARLLEARRKCLELSEIEARLAAIEARLKADPN